MNITDLATARERLRHLTRKTLEEISLEKWEDRAFLADVRLATLRGAHPASMLMMWAVVGVFACFLLWASVAEVDEVTSGNGKVIPSGQVQIVQNLEGGLVSEILVKDGDVVNKGDVLLRLDDTGFFSSFAEKKTKRLALMAALARLEAEATDVPLALPEEVIEEAPEIAGTEENLYRNRVAEAAAALDATQQLATQKAQEVDELKRRLEQLTHSHALLNEELELTRPLEKDGLVSRVELLRLERQANDLAGEKEAAALAVTRSQTALVEARQRVEEQRLKRRNDILAEQSKKAQELAQLNEVMKAVEDQVARTTVRAPVRGTVKRVLVNTVGGVIKPGMDLVELVPLEDSLLVEARVRPKDIAFLRPGQEATVKLTAYDFTIYGGLQAQLEQIGADTVVDERGEAYYPIRVRTEESSLSMPGGTDLPIIPGMVASVDIISGKKTILDYLLKPLRRTRERALRER